LLFQHFVARFILWAIVKSFLFNKKVFISAFFFLSAPCLLFEVFVSRQSSIDAVDIRCYGVMVCIVINSGIVVMVCIVVNSGIYGVYCC